MSYHGYWSLSKLPFGPPRYSSEYYFGRPQEEALARLNFLVTHGRPIGILIGPACSGRTTLLRFIESGAWPSAAGMQAVRIAAATATEPAQMLERLDALMHLNASVAGSRLREVSDYIGALGRSEVRTVVLVDDAERLTPEAVELLAGLASGCRQLTILLACVGGSDVRSLVEATGGCPLRADLEAWDLEDCRNFIWHGLRDAGGEPSIFSDAALVRLYELSAGLPGPLARLAELSLLAGAGLQVDSIDPDVVEAAEGELLCAATATEYPDELRFC